jgi:hypothetical protein
MESLLPWLLIGSFAVLTSKGIELRIFCFAPLGVELRDELA